ncbi:MAG: M23 family peptidase, partial [Actinobacteria bacterium]
MKFAKPLFAAVLMTTLSIPALADDVYPIIYPVIGPNTLTDSFGDPRPGGRTHEGVDIMADKMTPVVAAADGTVGWMHNEQGGNCCDMELIHDDGYSSVYIHLNNDSPGTDDGLGWGFAPGIAEGVEVKAGQIIAYVGDSGNAEATSPHLHFELRDPNGVAFDPYPSLLVAPVLDPVKADEFFFYRSSDGTFKYYDVNPDGSLGAPIEEG